MRSGLTGLRSGAKLGLNSSSLADWPRAEQSLPLGVEKDLPLLFFFRCFRHEGLPESISEGIEECIRKDFQGALRKTQQTPQTATKRDAKSMTFLRDASPIRD